MDRLFGYRIDLEEIYAEAISAWQAPLSGSDIDRTLQFYTELYLQDGILTKMDRAGMLNSLEVRSPFLDRDFVDLVRTIPAQLKLNGQQTKSILKRAVSTLLPKNIVSRSKKGFDVPKSLWFREKQLLVNTRSLEGLLDTKIVDSLYQEHLSGKADWSLFLWAHFVLERWVRQTT